MNIVNVSSYSSSLRSHGTAWVVREGANDYSIRQKEYLKAIYRN
jgi:hypothetical protein